MVAIALEGETDCQPTGYNVFLAGEGCGFNHNQSIKMKSVSLLLRYHVNISTTFLPVTVSKMSETNE